jgi:short-subunit dehydrogenase
MQIAGATVLLTGASGGIGHAVARAVAERGGDLILTGRRVDVLEPLAQELGARALAADLADRAAVDRLVADAGRVDILIANAGLPGVGALDSFTVEQIDRVLDVNLRAPIVLTHALTPAMVQRRNGHVVFMSSLNGKASTPLTSLYNATKFGMRGFASAIREDLRADSVGVSTIFPGFIRDAGMFVAAEAKLPPGVGTRSPEDVARATVKAIENNRAEVDVAPLSVRLGTTFASLAPEAASHVSRKMGAHKVAGEMAAGNADKR